MAKVNRSWFFTTSGDTKISGFWQRFLGGGISKPTENTFRNLTDSVAFHSEVNSAAQIDSNAALENKQGLVILSTDANAKAGNNTALGSTGGSVVIQPSQLPTVEAGEATPIGDMPEVSFNVTADPTVTTRNNYLLTLSSDFSNWLISRLFKAGGTIGQVPVKTSSNSYEWGWSNEYRTSSSTSLSIPSTLPTSVTFDTTAPADSMSYAEGVRIRITDSSNSINYIEGTISSYSGTSVTFIADNVGGSGTINSWKVNLGGSLPAAIETSNPQLWVSSESGDDVYGDGSNSKPYKTISRAKDAVQMIANVDPNRLVTMRIIGGTYINNVNVVVGSPYGYFYYNIQCDAGVKIFQGTEEFFNNQTLNAHVNVYGAPDITASVALPSPNVFNIKCRRDGSASTTIYLDLREINAGPNTAFYVLSYGNATAGAGNMHLKAASATSSNSSYTMLIDGQDNYITVKIASLTNSSTGIPLQLGGSGVVGVTSCGFSIYIVDTRLSTLTNTQTQAMIKIASLPEGQSGWSPGTSLLPFVFLERVAFSFYGGANSKAIDITGAGNGTNKIMIRSCMLSSLGGGGVFLNGDATDYATCVNNLSTSPNSVNVNAVALGTLPTVSVGSNRVGVYIQNYDF